MYKAQYDTIAGHWNIHVSREVVEYERTALLFISHSDWIIESSNWSSHRSTMPCYGHLSMEMIDRFFFF